MAHVNKDSKWEGKSTAELRNIRSDQLWPLLEDFCAFYKWFPALDSEKCHHIEGAYGEPGLVRYCQFTDQTSASLFGDTEARWCNEKLLSMDPVNRTLSYAVTENNLGFKSYVGNMKVVDIEGGCKIEWWFTSDPMEEIRLEDLKAFIESSLKIVAEGMKKELEVPVN
ncbi:hypothetical protein R6Q57_004011 [Mikania cordata]